MTERDQALAVVTETIPVFKKIDDLYMTANTVNQRKAVNATVAADKNEKKTNLTIFAKVFGLFILLEIGFLPYGALVSKMKNPTMNKLVIYPFAAIALCIYVFTRLKKKAKADSAGAVVHANDPLDAELRKISDKIYAVYTENQEIIERIPRDYRYYDAVSFLEKALANGRADNIKEALNLYETELHNRALENNSQRVLIMHQQQCNMLSDIESNTRSAARSANIAATFSFLGYLSQI